MRDIENKPVQVRLKLNLKDIGHQITLYRRKNNMTETQLAGVANLPQSSIARIEHGKNTSTATLAKLALAMNRNVSLRTNYGHRSKSVVKNISN